jgi:inner membrane protein
MSPITHLLASWVVATKTTDNPRVCRLVALAGLAPDLDGLGLVVDMVRNAIYHTDSYDLYQTYHHSLLHGFPGALLVAGLMAALARRRARVFLLVLATFHLHLLCDLLGSRGPDVGDVWPIYYGAPVWNYPVWIWHGQWRLDGWQNQLITFALLAWSLRLALKRGDSVVAVFNRRADAVFIATLRKWRADFATRRKAPSP